MVATSHMCYCNLGYKFLIVSNLNSNNLLYLVAIVLNSAALHCAPLHTMWQDHPQAYNMLVAANQT